MRAFAKLTAQRHRRARHKALQRSRLRWGGIEPRRQQVLAVRADAKSLQRFSNLHASKWGGWGLSGFMGIWEEGGRVQNHTVGGTWKRLPHRTPGTGRHAAFARWGSTSAAHFLCRQPSRASRASIPTG